VTYVAKIGVFEDNNVRVESEHEDGCEIIEVKLPVLASVVKSINEPRFSTVKGTMKANRTKIPGWTAGDLAVDEQRIGLRGSPTQVRKIFTPPQRIQGVIIKKDTAREAVAELIQKLSDAKIV
jgi:electron transfer flavoprotein beta subunit